MDVKRSFSLSYYFEELTRKTTLQHRHRGFLGERYSTETNVIVLKALKKAEEHQLPLSSLADTVKMPVEVCEEVVQQLSNEGLTQVEADRATGEDLVKLTRKGTELI